MSEEKNPVIVEAETPKKGSEIVESNSTEITNGTSTITETTDTVDTPTDEETQLNKATAEAATEGNKASDEKEEDAVKAEVETEATQSKTEVAPKKEEKKIGVPEIDLANKDKKELNSIFSDLMEKQKILDIRSQVDKIKVNFYKQHNAEIQQAKKEFIEAGNEAADFKVEPDPLEAEFKQLQKKYKTLKAKHNEEIEKNKTDNLKKKYEIIEKIKFLTQDSESLNKTFQDFKDLQQQWREVGPVPQSEIKNLWETYNYNIEKFYDFIKINKELRDLDLKKNLESKIELCEKAEELLIESNIVKAFKELQKHHATWREVGPIPNEKREEIWERFKDATSKINKKHQDFFEKKKDEEQNNLKAKTMLCEKAEELAAMNIKTHKEREEMSKEVVELQKFWRLIGFAPKKESNLIYERFKNACDTFFNKKRDFYNSLKAEQETNLQLKTELCIQAEALKESTDWKKTTEEYIKIQNEWKNIGPVARKHSDIIWKRFRTACNIFFENKDKHFSTIQTEQDSNYKLKLDLIEKVKSYAPSEDNKENLTALKTFQKEWTEIGHVPFKHKDDVQKEFRKAINTHFDKFETDEFKSSETNFANKLKTINQAGKNQPRMRQEREKIHSQLEKIRNDIGLLENNIGFFAKSKNAESLIKDVKSKIDNAKKQQKSLRDKLQMMDKYGDEQQ